MISAAMSASMNSIAWNPTIACPNCSRSLANASEFERARGRAHRACADHEPLLDEPVFRELVSLAHLAEHRVLGKVHALEREDRMLEHERVGVARRADQTDAWLVLVDEEDGRFRGIAVDVRVHQEEVRHVAGGHVPFLAVEDPSTIDVAPRSRANHRRVRACLLLGDRVRVAALPPGCGTQVALLLRLGAASERDRGAPREVPQRARGTAPLFLDQHLLEGVETLTPVFQCVIDRIEVRIEHRLFRASGTLRRQSVVLLAFVLERDQDLFGERPGALSQLAIDMVEADLHCKRSLECDGGSVGGAVAEA